MPVSESTLTRPVDLDDAPDTRVAVEVHEIEDESHIVRGLD